MMTKEDQNRIQEQYRCVLREMRREYIAEQQYAMALMRGRNIETDEVTKARIAYRLSHDGKGPTPTVVKVGELAKNHPKKNEGT